MVLDASNSRLYRAHPACAKHARIRWAAAGYELTWGRQHFPGPHMVVLNSGGHYGVDLATFFATHEAVPDREDHYVKVVLVRAMRVAVPIELVTIINGTQEMAANVPPGAFVVQNPGGEQYAMSAEEFRLRYVLLE